MSKSESKATHVFEVRMWSKRYYGGKKIPNKARINIWNGLVRNKKHKGEGKFHSVEKLLKILEDMYFKEEKKAKRK